MYYVYIIKSIALPEIVYVGSTQNVSARFATHNNGGSESTKRYKPWELIWCGEFKEKSTALKFELYLKTHSGKAFLRKHLI